MTRNFVTHCPSHSIEYLCSIGVNKNTKKKRVGFCSVDSLELLAIIIDWMKY